MFFCQNTGLLKSILCSIRFSSFFCDSSLTKLVCCIFFMENLNLSLALDGLIPAKLSSCLKMRGEKQEYVFFFFKDQNKSEKYFNSEAHYNTMIDFLSQICCTRKSDRM